MTDLKKTSKKILNDLKSVINEIKCETISKQEDCMQIWTEYNDYCKKRGEIELDYSRKMKKLNEIVTAKIAKIKTLIKADDNVENKIAIFELLKCAESETESKADNAKEAYELHSVDMTQIISNYMEFHKQKISMWVKFPEVVFNCMERYISQCFLAQTFYSEAYDLKEKKLKKLNKHKDKIKKLSRLSKYEQARQVYEKQLKQCDKSRNSYIFLTMCTNSTYNFSLSEIAKDIILMSSFKYEEVGSELLKKLRSHNKNCLQNQGKISNGYQKLVFQEKKETELMIKNMSKLFLNDQQIVHFIFMSGETNCKLTFDEILKKDMVVEIKELYKNISESNIELQKTTEEVEKFKNSMLIWNQERLPTLNKNRRSSVLYKTDEDKTYRNEVLFNCFNKYMDYLAQYMDNHYAQQYLSILGAETNLSHVNEVTNFQVTSNENIKNLLTFGIDLTEFCQKNKQKIPPVITILVDFLYHSQALTIKDIFKISPSQAELNEAKNCLQENGYIPPETSPHAACALLKQYILELKGFLNSDEIIKKFLKMIRLKGTIFENEVIYVLRNFTEPQKNLLIFIGKLINLVLIENEKNSVTVDDLSLIFAQLIFRDRSTELYPFLMSFSENIFMIFSEESPLYDINSIKRVKSEIANHDSQKDSFGRKTVSFDEI